MVIRFLASAILLIGLTSESPGTVPISIGIPAARFQSVAASQAKDEWCWAASIQMVLNWHGVAVKQKDVVQRIYGKTIDAAATEGAVTEALSGTAYTRSGQQVNIYSAYRRGAPDPNVLMREMGKQHPILITFRTGKNRLHAVVITAAEYLPTRSGPVVTSLLIRDPSPTRRHPGGEMIRVSGQNLIRFLPKINSYWLVEVH